MECWNTGILEYWLEPHDFCIWIKSVRINFYVFSMDIFIGSKNYYPIMAIMAFPYKWVSLSIYVFAIHGVIYPLNRRIFKRDGVSRTHYSSIPVFHHSNCERSELNSFLVYERLPDSLVGPVGLSLYLVPENLVLWARS